MGTCNSSTLTKYSDYSYSLQLSDSFKGKESKYILLLNGLRSNEDIYIKIYGALSETNSTKESNLRQIGKVVPSHNLVGNYLIELPLTKIENTENYFHIKLEPIDLRTDLITNSKVDLESIVISKEE